MNIEIYTDGACRGNQFDKNIGAYAYKIIKATDNYIKPILYKQTTDEYAEAVQNTTNNIMELTAVIKALEHLERFKTYNDKITIYSDSTYVVMGITVWYKGWIKRGWRNVKNAELWKKLITLAAKFKNITFQHVPGHAGNTNNEYVDRLCNEAMDKFEPEEQT